MVRRFVCGAAALLVSAGASADFTVRYNPTNARIRVVDNDTGAVVISDDVATRHAVFTPASGGDMIEPVVSWAPAGPSAANAEGLDLTLTFDNRAGTGARRPGPIYIPGITFGLPSEEVGRVRTRDFHVTGQAQDITTEPLATGWNTNQEAQYPGHLFAPVSYLHAGEYAIGVSLQYPLVDPAATSGAPSSQQYAHRVAFGNHLFPPHQGDRRTWEVAITLAARDFVNADPALTEGLVPAGEVRTYTLSVRLMRTSPPTGGAWGDPPQTIPENSWDLATSRQEWLRLFEPYRAYFTARYGRVRYRPDPRPIRGCTTAQAELVSATNPYGFVEAPGGGGRPFPEGWTYWRNLLLDLTTTGWSRFMVWTPTGLFPSTPVDHNFPFQFTSQWSAMAVTGAGPELLATISNEDRELGLWWGNSTHVMTTWPPAGPPPLLNPDDPAHVTLARREVDGAVNTANARAIGLDAFGYLPTWHAYHWLHRLQSWYPGVKFVIEPMPCDILTTLAPAYMLATRPGWAWTYRVVTPHYLGQLLVPGHEFWGAVERNHLRDELGRWPVESEIVSRCTSVAALGFAPIVFADASLIGVDISARTPDVLPARAPCNGDFNNDGDFGTDQDIEAFFACLAGNCCPTCATGDFNGDGDFGTDQDIEAFFRVMGGSQC